MNTVSLNQAYHLAATGIEFPLSKRIYKEYGAVRAGAFRPMVLVEREKFDLNELRGLNVYDAPDLTEMHEEIVKKGKTYADSIKSAVISLIGYEVEE